MSINKTDNRPNAIVVTDIKKAFRLPHENHSGLKQMLINLTRKNSNKGYEVQQVLKGVSFEVKKGDFFGIVGRNGSGKSTLLKLLAGIYTPDSGAIQTNGSVVPFIELGVGFNPELTGRENVFLNGALLGFSRDEMKAMYDDIVEFAELERFMDQKLKNYSSGMQVRLAFSIAIKAQGDILILDEVLAVGDEAFQRKCNEYFEKVRQDKTKTVILVTHSMESVRKYCNKAMMIRDGEVVAFGSPEDVANEYRVENLESDTGAKADRSTASHVVSDLDVKLISPRRVSQTDAVEILVKYRVEDENSTKILLNLIDANRHVPLYAASLKVPKGVKGREIVRNFRIIPQEINNASIKVAFPPEDTLPTFIVRRTDYHKSQSKNPYPILFDRGEWR